MAKKVYDSEEQAETAKQRASRFLRDVVGDDDRADEIEDESLDEWLEETGRRIENPTTQQRRNNMPATKTKADLLEENEALKEENEALNERLNQIFDIAADPDDESDEDDDSEDEDEEEGEDESEEEGDEEEEEAPPARNSRRYAR